MMNREKINTKILKAMEELIADKETNVKNKSHFAEILGVTDKNRKASMINDISKKRRNFSIDMIISFFKHFGKRYSPDNFFEIDKFSDYIAENDIDFFEDNISFLVDASAGTSISIEEKDKKFNFKIPDLERKHHAFRVRGDSMLPTLENGDILICMKVSDDSLKLGEVYVVLTNDGVNVKRVNPSFKNGKIKEIQLISDNKEKYPDTDKYIYPPINVDLSQGLHGVFFEAYLPVRRIIKLPQLGIK